MCYDRNHTSLLKEESKEMVEARARLLSQRAGMDRLLAQLGMRYDRTCTWEELRHDLEFYFEGMQKTERGYQWWNVGQGGWSSHATWDKEFQDATNRLCARDQVVLDTFRAIVLAYGCLATDLEHRYVRNPAMPDFLWPVLRGYRNLAHVEDEKGEVVCVGAYLTHGWSWEHNDPHAITVGMTNKEMYGQLQEVRRDAYQHFWLAKHGIPYKFCAPAASFAEERKSAKFKRDETVCRARQMAQDAKAEFAQLQAKLTEAYKFHWDGIIADVATAGAAGGATRHSTALMLALSELINHLTEMVGKVVGRIPENFCAEFE